MEVFEKQIIPLPIVKHGFKPPISNNCLQLTKHTIFLKSEETSIIVNRKTKPTYEEVDVVSKLPVLVERNRTDAERQPNKDRLHYLTLRRMQKHTWTLATFRIKLAEIRQIYEEKIKNQCLVTSSSLKKSWMVTETSLQNVEGSSMTFESLHEIFNQISTSSNKRTQMIDQFVDILMNIESDRLSKIKESIVQLTEGLPACSHLPPVQVQNAICNEAAQINNMLLINKRRIFDLSCSLHTEETVRLRQFELLAEDIKADWRNFNTKRVVDELKQDLTERMNTCPQPVLQLFYELSETMKVISERKNSILQEFRSIFTISNDIKCVTDGWITRLNYIYQELEQTHTEYLGKLFKAYETESNICFEKIRDLKATLMAEKYEENVSEIDRLVGEQCESVHVKSQTKAEGTLAYIDVCLEWSRRALKQNLINPIIHLVSTLATMCQENGIESLEACRCACVDEINENQVACCNRIEAFEDELGIAIDDVRMADNSESLQTALQRANEMLTEVFELHNKNHEAMATLIRELPTKYLPIVQKFSRDLCDFFGVRRCAKSEIPSTLKGNMSKKETKFEKYHAMFEPSTPYRRPLSQDSTRYFSTQFDIFFIQTGSEVQQEIYPDRPAQSNNLDTLFRRNARKLTNNATPPLGIVTWDLPTDFSDRPTFSWTRKSSELSSKSPRPEGVYLFPNSKEQIQSEAFNHFAIDEPSILVHQIKEFKTELRENCLIKLDVWLNDCMNAVDEDVEQRLNDQLASHELQLQMQEPRPRRVKGDIANVRAAELLQHKNRLVKHTAAINEALTEIVNSDIPLFKKEINVLESMFRDNVRAKIESLRNQTSTDMMQRLEKKIIETAQQHMKLIREKLCGFRESLEVKMGIVQNSNSEFWMACKLFSEGGCFSAGEALAMKADLDTLTAKVSLEDQSAFDLLETVERDQKTFAEDQIEAFKEHFHIHFTDLVYLEGMARCLRRAQTKIKAETGNSNSQAHRIYELLSSFHIDLVHLAQLNAGKSTSELEGNLHSKVFLGFNQLKSCVPDRCVYLACLRSQEKPKTDVNLETSNSSHSFKSNFSPLKSVVMKKQNSDSGKSADMLDLLVQQTTSQVFRKGRSALEDSSTKLVQELMLMNGDDRLQSKQFEEKKIPREDKPRNRFSRKVSSTSSKSQPSSRTKEDPFLGGSVISGKKGLQSSSRLTKTRATGIRVLRGDIERLMSNARFRIFGASKDSILMKSFHPNQLPEKIDYSDIENTTFLGRIRVICRESIESGIYLIEKYYTTKGNMPLTRPNLIHETPELACDALLSKLVGYYEQSEIFLSQSILEFQQQTIRLEQLSCNMATTFVDTMFIRLNEKCKKTLSLLDQETKDERDHFEKEKLSNFDRLRPLLGSIDLRDTELVVLGEKEKERQTSADKCWNALLQSKVGALQMACLEFSQKMPILFHSLLIRFDALVCGDEIRTIALPSLTIASGTTIEAQSKSDELNMPINVTKSRKLDKSTLEPINWFEFVAALRIPSSCHLESTSKTGFQEKHISCLGDDMPSTDHIKFRITSSKTTQAHVAATNRLQKAVQMFITYLNEEMDNAEQEYETFCHQNDQWKREWCKAFNTIRNLYSA